MPVLSQRHSFHLVDPSPWPILMAFGVLGFPMGFVLFFHGFVGGWSLIEAALYQMVFIAFLWWRDVIREGVFEGKHTAKVIRGLRLGMLLFIVSEIMFFFAFFWGFFYFAFNPAMALGYAWPPIGMQTLNGFEIPFLNTVVLLSSGATITWSHHALVYGSRREAMIALGVTILLAIYFTALQYFEYKEAPYSISDSVYGSIFYLTTGFHGFHVFIGTCFLAVCLVRLYLNHFSPTQHIGFEAAAWYWHFVDVVWLFLFICVYLWSVL